jgi:hypothetical protein
MGGFETEMAAYFDYPLSALIPEMVEAIQSGISKALAERSEEKEKVIAEIESFLDPGSKENSQD